MEAGQRTHLSEIAASLVREHKLATPFLFIDEERVVEALALFRTYLPDVQLFYAAKANPSVQLFKFFADKGLSLDVASAGEIATAIALGIPQEKLFLSTPIKTLETLEAMFRYNIASCAVDTIDEVERIAAYRHAKKYNRLPLIFVRIRIESKNIEVDLNRKFGCSLGEALSVIERATDLGFEMGGICFHVGTQCTSADNYFMGVESAMLVAKESLRRFNVRIPVINIGGGFCDQIAAAGMHLPTFYQAIGEVCKEAIAAGFRVYAEPGRCLVSAAGTLVTSVVGTNVRNDQRWAYLDDGIYGCYSIKLYEKHPFEFHCVNPVRKARPLRAQRTTGSGTWTIAGPTCDALDVVAEGIELPANLASGDLLMSPNMGAYSISTASRFNGFMLPRCYVIRSTMRNGKIAVSIRPDEAAQDAKILANA